MNRALIIAVLLSLCAGCVQPSAHAEKSPDDAGYAFIIYTDEKTGCQYLKLSGSGSAVTPRIAADGRTHLGCKGATL